MSRLARNAYLLRMQPKPGVPGRRLGVLRLYQPFRSLQSKAPLNSYFYPPC